MRYHRKYPQMFGKKGGKKQPMATSWSFIFPLFTVDYKQSQIYPQYHSNDQRSQQTWGISPSVQHFRWFNMPVLEKFTDIWTHSLVVQIIKPKRLKFCAEVIISGDRYLLSMSELIKNTFNIVLIWYILRTYKNSYSDCYNKWHYKNTRIHKQVTRKLTFIFCS